VFYTLLLEPFNLKGTILYLEAPKQNTLREFSDDVYKVERIIKRQRNKNN